LRFGRRVAHFLRDVQLHRAVDADRWTHAQLRAHVLVLNDLIAHRVARWQRARHLHERPLAAHHDLGLLVVRREYDRAADDARVRHDYARAGEGRGTWRRDGHVVRRRLAKRRVAAAAEERVDGLCNVGGARVLERNDEQLWRAAGLPRRESGIGRKGHYRL